MRERIIELLVTTRALVRQGKRYARTLLENLDGLRAAGVSEEELAEVRRWCVKFLATLDRMQPDDN